MLELYTERARRVLFFANYEAGQAGSESIQTEHLLLGLVREARGLSAHIFARARVSLDEVRKTIESRTVVREKRPAPSGELPYSDETRRVLELTAEEADRLLHNYIGTEHLLLGILREPQSIAASILAEHGLRVDTVRDDIVMLLSEPATMPPVRRGKPDLAPSEAAMVVPTHRTQHESVSANRGSDYWTVEGAPLKTMLSTLYDMQTTRIELPVSLDDEQRFDFLLVLPHHETRETMGRLMREAIEKHFRISIAHESRLMDVYVITAPSGTINAKELRGDEPGSFGWMEVQTPAGVSGNFRDFSAFLVQELAPPADEALHTMGAEFLKDFAGAWKRGTASIRGMSAGGTIEQLCETLEETLDRPVIDETNLTGAYELDVRTDAATSVEFLHALCDRLGLAATSAQREVTMLVARQT
jgi:uncharacterized protein (TIGR03435 family)